MSTKTLRHFIKLSVVLSVFFAVLLTSGCAERDPHFALLPEQGIFTVTPNNKVDILWVIDNSGSMGPKQDNLENSIASFTQKFVDYGLDFQIAVVTTDIRPIDPMNPNDPNFSGQDACFQGTPSIVTPSTANLAATLGANANVGFFGSADAHGLNAAVMALKSPRIDGCNNGFFRPDAFLSIIEFSDADDNTTAVVDDILTDMDGLRSQAKHPKTGEFIRTYMFSAMVVDDLAKPECVALGPFSEVGTKYIDIANKTGGVVESICEADFSPGLLSVSNRILEKTTAVILGSVPDLTTTVVYMNSVEVPHDSTNGWTYNSTDNSIVFHGNHIPRGDSVNVVINYKPKDIVR